MKHPFAAALSIGTLLLGAAVLPSLAQMSHSGPMPHGMPMQHAHDTGALPQAPGQDAFGAVQEIVSLLEADPKTDWSKVDLEALRQHLIDMNAVVLNAVIAQESIESGLTIRVTGAGRTAAAIKRMLPAHAAELDRIDGWRAKTDMLTDGVVLTVTAEEGRETLHIRGLGFIGLLATGSHHQLHHLMLARGEIVH